MQVRGFRRSFIYHSPQVPGYTCWCGLWNMPDGGVMLSFTQATGPFAGREKAPPEVRHALSWPPPAHSDAYDMTGLDLRHVHLRSGDFGETWHSVASQPFRSCMNGVYGEAEESLPDGTILRAAWGPYLPYDEVPRTGYVERSTDGARTWSAPQIICRDSAYKFWPRRIRMLRDGRVVAGGGLILNDAEHATRSSWSRGMGQALFISSDGGRYWEGPIATATSADAAEFTGEEFDFVELTNGDLLLVIRCETRAAFDTRDRGQERRQTRLVKTGETWKPTKVRSAPFPHSGHPELLRLNNGTILHVATSGFSATTDEGGTWRDLDLPSGLIEQEWNWPGAYYYPKAVQMRNGEILAVGHVGWDDPYGRVDQSIAGIRFFIDW